MTKLRKPASQNVAGKRREYIGHFKCARLGASTEIQIYLMLCKTIELPEKGQLSGLWD